MMTTNNMMIATVTEIASFGRFQDIRNFSYNKDMNLKPKVSARLMLFMILFGFLVSDLVNYPLFAIWPVILYLLIVLALVAIVFKDQIITLVVLASLFLILGFTYANFRNSLFLPNNNAINQTEIVGMVSGRPVLTDKQQLVLTITDRNKSYKVLVHLSRYPEYHYGQKLKISGKLEKPVVFADFNYQNYLAGKQIYLVVNRAEKIEDLGFAGSKFKAVLFNIADDFEKALNRSLPEPEASFAAGLLLGSRRNLPQAFTDSMQITGTSHLVAISGYNVTIIAMVLAMLLLPLGRRLSYILIVLLIVSFIVLTGGSASVVRGGLASLLFLLGKTFDRRADQTNLLLLAAVLILLFNPLELLYDMGFLLSFASFAGLIYLGPYVNKILDIRLKIIPKILKSTVAETLSAQLFTLPLLIFAFGRFSVIAPLPNLLILPLIPLAMLMSIFSGLFGLIGPIFGQIFGYISWFLLWYPIKIIELFSRIPLASYNLRKGNLLLSLVLYIIIILIVLRFSKRFKNVILN